MSNPKKEKKMNIERIKQLIQERIIACDSVNRQIADSDRLFPDEMKDIHINNLLLLRYGEGCVDAYRQALSFIYIAEKEEMTNGKQV